MNIKRALSRKRKRRHLRAVARTRTCAYGCTRNKGKHIEGMVSQNHKKRNRRSYSSVHRRRDVSAYITNNACSYFPDRFMYLGYSVINCLLKFRLLHGYRGGINIR